MKKILIALLTLTALAGCDIDDGRVVSKNLSKEADNFGILRRIIFYNGITNDYMLSIEGYCSQEHTLTKLAVTCKTGTGVYKKHFLGLSHNVTYFSEQLDSVGVSKDHYKVTFKPSVILPDIEIR